MGIVLVTGSCGLIGSEASRFYAKKGYDVVGIDNDMRASFFGTSIQAVKWSLIRELEERYRHKWVDIRDRLRLENVFKEFSSSIKLVIHTAAQPSHDWAARDPFTDFDVNAVGTLNMLEMTRRHSPDAAFIFTSTNKVYGDRPNQLPLIEQESRFDLPIEHPYRYGIPETMPIDDSTHSVFGASKVAADVMCQEYGRYFGLKTGTFRCGCLTGSNHQGAKLHGFLSYLVKCVKNGEHYNVIGYGGKQVRDNIHSLDVIKAFDRFFQYPKAGAVYNLGGGLYNHCSVLEAIRLAETATGKRLSYTMVPENRIGDHKWYISDLSKFQSDYPTWEPEMGLVQIIADIAER